MFKSFCWSKSYISSAVIYPHLRCFILKLCRSCSARESQRNAGWRNSDSQNSWCARTRIHARVTTQLMIKFRFTKQLMHMGTRMCIAPVRPVRCQTRKSKHVKGICYSWEWERQSSREDGRILGKVATFFHSWGKLPLSFISICEVKQRRWSTVLNQAAQVMK